MNIDTNEILRAHKKKTAARQRVQEVIGFITLLTGYALLAVSPENKLAGTLTDGDIRRAYGITDADVRRIRAAVVYALRRLTRDGDIEDYILGPGQQLAIHAGDLATVQALQPCRLRLIPD